MAKNITITGNGPVDEERRAKALLSLNKVGSADELEKLVKLAKNPMYKGMLKTL